MKKVLTNPLFILLLLCAALLSGILWGRRTTISEVKLKINDETGRTYEEEQPTLPEANDYIIGDRININSASAETLAILPGIGEGLAKRIVDYRTQNGPFKSIDDLLNVEGIGENKLNDIRPYITLH